MQITILLGRNCRRLEIIALYCTVGYSSSTTVVVDSPDHRNSQPEIEFCAVWKLGFSRNCHLDLASCCPFVSRSATHRLRNARSYAPRAVQSTYFPLCASCAAREQWDFICNHGNGMWPSECDFIRYRDIKNGSYLVPLSLTFTILLA